MDNRNFWNRFARIYDAFTRRFTPDYPTVIARIALDVGEAQRVLEVATGTGLIALELGEKHEVDAIDISPAMIAQAEEKMHARGLVGIQFKVGDDMARRDWYCEDVLSGRIEIDKVWEDDRVLAFHHPIPTSEIHVVVIPKSHIGSILDPEAADGSLLKSMVLAVQHVARDTGLDRLGFYVRLNAASEGVTPHMHWHIHGPGIP